MIWPLWSSGETCGPSRRAARSRRSIYPLFEGICYQFAADRRFDSGCNTDTHARRDRAFFQNVAQHEEKVFRFERLGGEVDHMSELEATRLNVKAWFLGDGAGDSQYENVLENLKPMPVVELGDRDVKLNPLLESEVKDAYTRKFFCKEYAMCNEPVR